MIKMFSLFLVAGCL